MGRARHPHDALRPASRSTKIGVEIYRSEGDIEPLRTSLTPRQRAFCHEYVVDFNAAAAAIRAGYAVKYSDKQGYLLTKNIGVAAYIDYLTASKEAKVTAVTPDYVLAQITSVVHKENVRDGDKLRALELLARHLGMLTDKIESKTTIDVVEKQKIEEEASNFTNALKGLRDRARKEAAVKDVTIL